MKPIPNYSVGFVGINYYSFEEMGLGELVFEKLIRTLYVFPMELLLSRMEEEVEEWGILCSQ